MGSSSSKKEKIEPPPPQKEQKIKIEIDIRGISELFNSVNKGSTRLEGSSFRLLDGDAAPPQNYEIDAQSKNKHINIPINPFMNNNSIKSSQNQNNDKKNENKTHSGKDINPNVKMDKNLNTKKETSKGSKNKEEINPNMGKFHGVDGKEEFTKPSNNDNNVGNDFNPSNYQFFTKTGNNNDNNIERQKDNFNSPGDNKDNNEIHDNNHPLDKDYNNEEENNNSLAKSVLVASLQNLNFTDPKDMLIIKQTATQKYNEGYFPLFVKMNHRITYYYLKQESTLKNLLYAHLNSLKLHCSEEIYSFYNKGKELNPNIPIIDIDSLPILSIIEIKEKE